MNFLLFFLVSCIYFGISMKQMFGHLNKNLLGYVCVPVADLISPDVRFTLDEEPVVQAAIVPSGGLYGQRPTYRRTQLLYQESVVILEERNGWYRVRALEQEVIDADGSRGCHGWIQVLNVSIDIAAPPANLVVTQRCVDVYSKPLQGLSSFLQFSCGTKLAGVVYDNFWYKVNLFEGNVGFIARTNLRCMQDAKKLTIEQVRKNVVQCVQQFINIPYVWGGRNAFGIDCSALIQLAYLAQGITIPRYAHGQWKASRPVLLKDLKEGDLIFLGAMRDKQLVIIHVMLYAGNDILLEAHGFLGKVRQVSVIERLGCSLHELTNGDSVPLRRFVFGGSMMSE